MEEKDNQNLYKLLINGHMTEELIDSEGVLLALHAKSKQFLVGLIDRYREKGIDQNQELYSRY